MKKLLSTLGFMLVAATIFAQNNFISFDKPEHDFGTQKEELEKLDYDFVFKNTTTGPIKLLDVKASCGCTTPKWSKDVVQPGQTGTITASYGASNRPGKFDKTITVRAAKAGPNGIVTDSTNVDLKILRIKGDVTPRTKGPKDWYPFEEGNLRYSTNHISFGNVTNKEIKDKELTVYNQGKKAITFGNVETKPYVKVDFVNNKKTVNPTDSLKIKVTYDASQVKDWDWQHERIYIESNDDTLAKKTLYLSATLLPHFDKMTKEDSSKAAKINFDKTTHEFGEIGDQTAVTTNFVFTNNGKADLEILKTKATCGCTATEPEKKLLKPGETSNIKVTFDPRGKDGEQFKQVTIISNDPSQPSVKLNIKAKVKKSDSATPTTPTTPGTPTIAPKAPAPSVPKH